MGFRYRPGLGVPYEQQGLIFFTGMNYADQPPRTQKKIERLCRAAAGEHWRALMDYVTTAAGTVAICQRHNIGENTLHRAVRRYYRMF